MAPKICVVGLGYVGLPLAVTFAHHFPVVGFDIDSEKIAELNDGVDRTKEVSSDELTQSSMEFSSDPKVISESDVIIVAVPTPIDTEKNPDLTILKRASSLVGSHISKGAIVVYESTVFPGVTEDECLPILEKESGMKLGDFTIGYSPERINPGDKTHTVDKIIKVVSGSDQKTCDILADVYGKIIPAGIHKAPTIKTAEAAKVIENVQRDLNIALMNELSLIFSRMDVNTHDVLEAAGTKWNFHKYHPGLVGGHCIGVDPYYLTFKAKQLGYDPKIILAGRDLNDAMGFHVGNLCISALQDAGKKASESTVVVMGLTFKENVPDYRNSRAKDVVEHLKQAGVKVIGCEPLLSEEVTQKAFGVDNVAFDSIESCDAIILVNKHAAFDSIGLQDAAQKMKIPIIVDVKAKWKTESKEGLRYVSL